MNWHPSLYKVSSYLPRLTTCNVPKITQSEHSSDVVRLGLQPSFLPNALWKLPISAAKSWSHRNVRQAFPEIPARSFVETTISISCSRLVKTIYYDSTLQTNNWVLQSIEIENKILRDMWEQYLRDSFV